MAPKTAIKYALSNFNAMGIVGVRVGRMIGLHIEGGLKGEISYLIRFPDEKVLPPRNVSENLFTDEEVVARGGVFHKIKGRTDPNQYAVYDRYMSLNGCPSVDRFIATTMVLNPKGKKELVRIDAEQYLLTGNAFLSLLGS